MSTTSMTVSSRSSRNFLMNGWPARAVTFQSMVRMSSPTSISIVRQPTAQLSALKPERQWSSVSGAR